MWPSFYARSTYALLMSQVLLQAFDNAPLSFVHFRGWPVRCLSSACKTMIALSVQTPYKDRFVVCA